MKKLVSVVLALVLLFALAVSASALTATVSYNDGVLSWNVTEFEGSVGVYVNGAQVGGSAQGKKSINLKPGDVVVVADLNDSKTFTNLVVEATATPAPTATPTVEPTATPTVEPTATPTVEPTATPTVEPTATPTVRPTATPTAKPTKVPSTDVPKTGNSSNAVYVMGGLMLLAGACLLLSRKVSK